MAYYAQRFPLVEMETLFRFPPTAAIAQQWIDRTPTDFKFDIPVWSLLTDQPTFPPSLWEDLVNEIKPDRRDQPRLYAKHLSQQAYDECWGRFTHALGPLIEQQRLGTLILRYPRWFKPRPSSQETLIEARARLGNINAAIEFTAPEWVESESCESTFAMLEDLEFGFVSVDAHQDNPRGLKAAAATTSDTAVMRLSGRRAFDDESAWAADRRSYAYSDAEIDELVGRITHLAECAHEVHVLVSTCWRDDAVRNAERLVDALTNATAIQL